MLTVFESKPKGLSVEKELYDFILSQSEFFYKNTYFKAIYRKVYATECILFLYYIKTQTVFSLFDLLYNC